MFTIEKAIPVPPSAARGIKANKYPFAQMENGDSFLAPTKSLVFAEGTPAEEVNAAIKKAQQANYNNLARVKSAYVKANPGVEFTLRKVEGGVRVWRTA